MSSSSAAAAPASATSAPRAYTITKMTFDETVGTKTHVATFDRVDLLSAKKVNAMADGIGLELLKCPQPEVEDDEEEAEDIAKAQAASGQPWKKPRRRRRRRTEPMFVLDDAAARAAAEGSKFAAGAGAAGGAAGAAYEGLRLEGLVTEQASRYYVLMPLEEPAADGSGGPGRMAAVPIDKWCVTFFRR